MVETPVDLEEGEPPAGPWEVVRTGALAAMVLGAAGQVLGRPRIIGIDGRGGAGKTWLADALAALVPRSAVVHSDDVAWHHSFFGWGGLMATHVLEPLRAGRDVDYRPPGWVEKGRPGSVAVPAGLDVVWVEGCGVISRQLSPLLDASVWVQVDRRAAGRRLLARDGSSAEQLQLIEDWDREERPLRLQERPWERADVVVTTGSDRVPVPPDHVAVAPPVR